MSEISLHDRFEQVNDDFIKFERIPEAERLHPNRKLCGFLKLASLAKNPAKFDMGAGHDVIWLSNESEMVPLTDADVLYLTRCGIFWSSDSDCLAMFT